MAAHDWLSKGFVHSAPGAVDCWDQKVVCKKCETDAVLLNQTRPMRAARYESTIGSSTGRARVDAVRKLKDKDFLPEDCDQMIVDAVHRL